MDLKEQLRNQIYFISTSCNAYDQDQVIEAVRIAVSLRILFHDTRNQTSLLTQLGAGKLRILSDVSRIEPNAVFFSGMGRIKLSGTAATIEPALGNAFTKLLMSREDWWQQIVALVGSVKVSRKDIVLGAANKEGGAHVDPKMGENYKKLRQGLWRVVYHQGGKTVGSEPIPKTQLVCLRQMGHEILNSPELVALSR